MKKLAAIWVIVAIYVIADTTPVPAETMYVGDITKLNVRAEKGTDSPVIETLPSGEKVEIVTFTGGWTKIRLPNGAEGWVASRFLSDEKPPELQIETLKEQLESRHQEIEDLKAETDRLKADNQALANRLDETMDKLAVIQNAYASLKDDSKDYLTLKKKCDGLTSELTEKTSHIKNLEQMVSDRYLSIAIKWFLAGAGVFMAGFLMGNRTKRKRSSLL